MSIHGAARYYPETEEILYECERTGWAFVAWEPMGTGEKLPNAKYKLAWRRQTLDRIEEIAAKHGVTPHVARLAAVLWRANQIIAIPGTSNLNHLEANMTALRLSEEDDFGDVWKNQYPVFGRIAKSRRRRT